MRRWAAHTPSLLPLDQDRHRSRGDVSVFGVRSMPPTGAPDKADDDHAGGRAEERNGQLRHGHEHEGRVRHGLQGGPEGIHPVAAAPSPSRSSRPASWYQARA